MPVFKIVVSEPKTRKSYQLEVDQSKVPALIGKRIGDQFDGSDMGLKGYTLEIRGGTDKDGFPMHPDLKGEAKRKLLLSGLPGFKPEMKGQRKRKMVHGNTVSADIVQLNVKIVKAGAGAEPLEKLSPKKGKEPEVKEEKAEPQQGKPEEKKAEEKKSGEKKPEEKKSEPQPEKPEKVEKVEKPEIEKPKTEKIEKTEKPKPEKSEAGGGEGKE